MNTNSEIDTYINTLPAWQRSVCEKVRESIHMAEPNIVEEIKFKNRPYFTYLGNVCALLATKDHVNIFIYDPIVPDPTGLINQGHENATARSIQLYEGDLIDEQACIGLIKAVAANNRQGGWRRLKDA